jgi:ABC-type glutathione transport system ATPase component
MSDGLYMKDLNVRIGRTLLVNNASLTVRAGQVTALVGASGSGKTLLSRALMGLVDIRPGVVQADYRIEQGGKTWRPYDGALSANTRAREATFASVRGDIVGYLPQNAVAALNPMWTIRRHIDAAAAAAGQTEPAEFWLDRAGLVETRRVATLYPHELSGGMAQRVGIAQSLARRSVFLLADEPTTGLDPTVQTAILRALRDLADTGMGLLLITHDLRIVPDLADDVVLMDRGRVVETSSPEAFRRGLLRSDAGHRLFDATERIAAGRLG